MFRESLKTLAKQYFQYGFWRSKTVLNHPKSLKLRQLIPVLFIISLVFAAIFNIGLFYLLIFVYFIACLIAMLSVKEDINWFSKLSMLIVFPTIHFSWGIGFLSGLVAHIVSTKVKGNARA